MSLNRLAARAEAAAANDRRRSSGRGVSGLVWLTCLLLLLGFAFQGTRALWSTDEGRYTENALQMIATGDYLVPAYSAQRVNFSKPPVTYWVIAGAVQLLGRNAWAVRTPYALAFIVTALLLCAMARQLTPDKHWLPGLVYGCALGPFVASNAVSTDVLLTLFEAVAMLGFVAWEFNRQGGPRRAHLWLMWLGFGLAFLTKGPPGLVAFLAIVPFVALRDGGPGLRRIVAPDGLAIFFVVGFLWYLVVMIRYPWLLHYFLHYEIYDRLLTATHHRHSQWYGWIEVYVPVLVFGTLPWWPALARGLRRGLSGARWREWWKNPSATLFLLLWFLVPLAVFCAAKSRLPMYILPLFLPLSLMLALELRDRIDFGESRQRVWLVLWVAVLLAVKGSVSLYVHPKQDNRLRAQRLVAVVKPESYTALAFVEDTGAAESIEEHTPWGMRLYIDRPIYGVAWRQSDGQREVCRLLHGQGPVLYAVSEAIKPSVFEAAVSSCSQHTVQQLGTWRHRTLIMARRGGG